MPSERRKLHRSIEGCAVCRIKSTKEPFVNSNKWEKYFDRCFHLTSNRSKEICRSCIKIISKWRRQPIELKEDYSKVRTLVILACTCDLWLCSWPGSGFYVWWQYFKESSVVRATYVFAFYEPVVEILLAQLGWSLKVCHSVVLEFCCRNTEGV